MTIPDDPHFWFMASLLGLLFCIVLMSVLAFVTRRTRRKEQPRQEPADDDENADKERRAWLILDLQRRQANSRLWAAITLMGILGAIALGVGLFIQATVPYDPHNDIATISGQIERLNSELQLIGDKHGVKTEIFIDSLGAASNGQVIRSEKHSHDTGYFDPRLLKYVDKVCEQQLEVGNKLLQLRFDTHAIAKAIEPLKDKPYQNRVLDLVSLTFIRIGIIVILVYACQILLRVYRYYMRTADHFSSLLDAMVMAKVVDVTMKDALELVRSNVDVGPGPKAPSDKMMDTAAAMLGKKE